MRILALETAAKAVSAAITEDGKVLASGYQDTGLTHSRTLMPMVEDMLANSGLALEEMDAIAVAAGPGGALPGGLHQLVQVAGAGVAVAEGALNKNLGLAQVLRLPAGAQTEGVQFRGELAHFLTGQHRLYRSFPVVS